MTSVRELADEYHAEWLAFHPLDACYMGITGYDHLVPDASEAGESAWRSKVESYLKRAHSLEAPLLSEADTVTLGFLISNAEQDLIEVDSRDCEYMVTAQPFKGPATLFGLTARTALPDPEAARDYLDRLSATGPWIDQQVERLRTGASKERFPVIPLAEKAASWAERLLAEDVPEPLSAAQPPDGWAGTSEWLEQRDALIRLGVKPALGRWVETIKELLPRSRSSERPGLAYLPGGEADYAGAIKVHTTLPLSADELHQIGVDEVQRLEERARSLGKSLGLNDLAAVHRALQHSAGQLTPDASMAAARLAISRAESQLSSLILPPLPPPCEVAPMPHVVASAGSAPHYSPPHQDGSKPGIYWFNTELPTAGTGWDLEVVAFHEAVPGHHLQFARLQALEDLPAMQRDREVTVSSEGWGLYAEQLAEEIGLYSSTEALLGSVCASLMRASRLVIDTGLHHFGWSRSLALEYFVAHVPMPADFLEAEVDRYISWPGQALGYLTGKRELLRIRDEARNAIGPTFSLPQFHARILDGGALPIPVLEARISRWTAGLGRGQSGSTGL